MNTASLRNVHLPFWIFTLAIFTILIIPDLIRDGMFMDGQIYACVSKNLANGLGTFWNPHFSNTAMSSFHEQPPLFFGIQSIFFKLLGNSIYSERICSFLMASATAVFINLTWKQFFNHTEDSKVLGWLPILFWISIPVCFWTYINNVEETIMSVFVILSVFLILKGIKTPKPIPYLIAAGLSIFCASLCKGMQGLFPIATLACYWLTSRQITFQKMLLFSLILIGVPTILYGCLMTNTTIVQSFQYYFENRIIRTFNNVGSTTDSRFYLLGRLLLELIPVFSICLLLLIFARLKRIDIKKIKPEYQSSLFFILLGLCGSLPLMITFEQRGFYLTTSLPYFAIGIAILVIPIVNLLLSGLYKKPGSLQPPALLYSSITLLCICSIISLSMIGKTKRDNEMLHDVYLIGQLIPENSVVHVDPPLYSAWNLQSYFIRHFNISLDPYNKHTYFLIEKNTDTIACSSDYKKIELQTLKYNLYKLLY